MECWTIFAGIDADVTNFGVETGPYEEVLAYAKKCAEEIFDIEGPSETKLWCDVANKYHYGDLALVTPQEIAEEWEKQKRERITYILIPSFDETRGLLDSYDGPLDFE